MAQIIVVGAGAAGLFATWQMLQNGHAVTLVEHTKKAGTKLSITGKGRCNVTNRCDERLFLENVRRNAKFMCGSIYRLPPERLMRLFEEALNIPLKTERGRRVFPQSDDAKDVVNALKNACGGATYLQAKATDVIVENGRAAGVQLQDGRKLTADAVLLATGGCSYPITGSTGDGYTMAKACGHTIIEPQPSLVSLVEDGNTCKQMQGLSLRNVQLTLFEDDKKVFEEQGEMLFTHFGLTGPLVLSASAFVDAASNSRYLATLDLKPALDEDQLDSRLIRDFAAASNQQTARSLDKLLPNSMRPVVLRRWGVDARRAVHQITKEERAKLVALIRNFSIPILRKGDLTHAVVTAGGVDVLEVDPATMESKLLPGLYFAGELLDIDAYTGGYNLHIAWSTAYTAAHAIDR